MQPFLLCLVTAMTPGNEGILFFTNLIICPLSANKKNRYMGCSVSFLHTALNWNSKSVLQDTNTGPSYRTGNAVTKFQHYYNLTNQKLLCRI